MQRDAESRKTYYLQSVLVCVRNKLIWLLVTSTVLRGERKAVMTNSATARSRKRWPTRTYQSHTALCRCGIQETFQENGPTYVDSSSRRIQTIEWQICGHGAFEINHDVLGIRPTDQSCHHEVWIHLSRANAPLVDQYRSRNPVRSEHDWRQGQKRGNLYYHM